LVITSFWEKKKDQEMLEAFSNLLLKTAQRRSFWGPSKKELFAKIACFKEKAGLLLVSQKKDCQKPVGGLLVLTSGETLYHEHSATSEEGEAANAPYLLIWGAIEEGRRRKLKRFDLGGIYDQRYHQATKRWKGFTTFKSRFKGEEIEYPKPLIKYYHPLTKALSKIGGA
jgi:lipid II:glycine glycyltransferase (peptidoglycan interpeptide bridge formation enzyme)